MNLTCTCGGNFRDAEDFRDHMPCPGSPLAKLKRVDAALLEMRTTFKLNKHAQEWANFLQGHIEDLKCCRYCNEFLLPKNIRIADGCPCNAPRGVNHGLVPKDTCTCVECDPEQTGGTRYPF